MKYEGEGMKEHDKNKIKRFRVEVSWETLDKNLTHKRASVLIFSLSLLLLLINYFSKKKKKKTLLTVLRKLIYRYVSHKGMSNLIVYLFSKRKYRGIHVWGIQYIKTTVVKNLTNLQEKKACWNLSFHFLQFFKCFDRPFPPHNPTPYLDMRLPRVSNNLIQCLLSSSTHVLNKWRKSPHLLNK